VSFRIDIVLINAFDIAKLGDYNIILSNLSKEEVKDLTSDLLNNKDAFFSNPSNCFFGKLNNMSTRGPLCFYNYPNTNSFVNYHPGFRFGDAKIIEFCRLYPDVTNQIRQNILYDFLVYYHEEDFFSLFFPSQNVVDILELNGINVDSNLKYFSQTQLYELLKHNRNLEKNKFLSFYKYWVYKNLFSSHYPS